MAAIEWLLSIDWLANLILNHEILFIGGLVLFVQGVLALKNRYWPQPKPFKSQEQLLFEESRFRILLVVLGQGVVFIFVGISLSNIEDTDWRWLALALGWLWAYPIVTLPLCAPLFNYKVKEAYKALANDMEWSVPLFVTSNLIGVALLIYAAFCFLS